MEKLELNESLFKGIQKFGRNSVSDESDTETQTVKDESQLLSKQIYYLYYRNSTRNNKF